MTEYLHALDSNGACIKTAPRNELYKELIEHSVVHGDAPYAIEAGHILLQNRRGELYAVRRSRTRSKDPGLLSTSVGFHVPAESEQVSHGDFLRRVITAAENEARDEVGIDLIVADQDVYDTHRFQRDTSQQAIVRPIAFDPWEYTVEQWRDGRVYVKRWKAITLAGVYDGELRYVDGEAEGVEFIKLHDLEQRVCSELGLLSLDIPLEELGRIYMQHMQGVHQQKPTIAFDLIGLCKRYAARLMISE